MPSKAKASPPSKHASTSSSSSSSSKLSKRPLTPEEFHESLRPGDIVCGRASARYASRPENVRYREIIEIASEEYESVDMIQKAHISKRVVNQMVDQKLRFISHNKDMYWEEFDFRRSVEKVSQSFRDLRLRHRNTPTSTPSSSSSKKKTTPKSKGSASSSAKKKKTPVKAKTTTPKAKGKRPLFTDRASPKSAKSPMTPAAKKKASPKLVIKKEKLTAVAASVGSKGSKASGKKVTPAKEKAKTPVKEKLSPSRSPTVTSRKHGMTAAPGAPVVATGSVSTAHSLPQLTGNVEDMQKQADAPPEEKSKADRGDASSPWIEEKEGSKKKVTKKKKVATKATKKAAKKKKPVPKKTASLKTKAGILSPSTVSTASSSHQALDSGVMEDDFEDEDMEEEEEEEYDPNTIIFEVKDPHAAAGTHDLMAPFLPAECKHPGYLRLLKLHSAKYLAASSQKNSNGTKLLVQQLISWIQAQGIVTFYERSTEDQLRGYTFVQVQVPHHKMAQQMHFDFKQMVNTQQLPGERATFLDICHWMAGPHVRQTLLTSRSDLLPSENFDDIMAPRYMDVCMGNRDHEHSCHLGNLAFRWVMDCCAGQMYAYSNGEQRAQLVESLVKEIQSQGVSFVDYSHSSNRWERIPDAKAVTETSLALRRAASQSLVYSAKANFASLCLMSDRAPPDHFGSSKTEDTAEEESSPLGILSQVSSSWARAPAACWGPATSGASLKLPPSLLMSTSFDAESSLRTADDSDAPPTQLEGKRSISETLLKACQLISGHEDTENEAAASDSPSELPSTQAPSEGKSFISPGKKIVNNIHTEEEWRRLYLSVSHNS